MISVIIPVHNAGKFLRETVGSVLIQPEVSTIILAEDGSTDDSAVLCAELARESPKIVFLQHPGRVNLGAGATRNLGIGQVNTKYVAFLDADDYYLPGRFRKTIEVLDAHSEADGVYDAVEQISDATGHRHLITLPCTIAPAGLYWELVVGKKGAIHLNGITVRRTVFDRSGLFPVDLIEAQDTVWIMKTVALAHLLPGEMKKPVAVLRVHDNNRVTQRSSKRQVLTLRSHRRNIALLDWASNHLGSKSLALMRVFAVRRLAEAQVSPIRNRALRFVAKRLLMFWNARQTPALWVHPAFIAALSPGFVGRG